MREIISNIIKIRHYFALYCQDKISNDFYANFRNFVTDWIRRSKKRCYEHKFNAARNDIQQTWLFISNIINTKNGKVENTVKKIIQNDVFHEDSEEVVNMFNDYFVYM